MESARHTVQANGITQAVRVAGPPDGVPVVLPGCGRSPHLERPAEFVAELWALAGVPAGV